MNERQMNFRLAIRQDKCDGCSSRSIPICTEVCPYDAIYPDVNSNYVWVECNLITDCALCRKCADACPQQAIVVRRIPKLKVRNRSISYFETPGIQNTQAVVAAVTSRVAEGDIQHVVVASASGSSAWLLAQALKEHSVTVISISAPIGAHEKIGWQPLSGRMARRLGELGVICRPQHVLDAQSWLENEPGSFERSTFYDWRTHRHYKVDHLDSVLYDTLISVGGMGLKTAVECIFSACAYGDVQIGEEVIGTAGSAWGLDTAAVIRATTAEKCFSQRASERLEIREILVMPRKKQRWR